ncbi:MAG: dihydrofolate reductase [Dysosmobacter welbionis]
MNAIVVTDKQWAIGRSGDLLFSLPGDMKHFRELTTGGTVIMGRKTLDSFPGGRPLPKRRNIVITRDPDFHREGCETVPRRRMPGAGGDEENVWLIGGGSIYAALLGRCRRASVTRSDHHIGCQHLFPRIWTPSI